MRARVPLPPAQPPPPLTLYRVKFFSYDGTPFNLDTTDPGKIGPWLAEMYGLFPYMARAETSVEIRTIEGFHGG